MALKVKQVTLGPTDGAGALTITFRCPGLVKAVGLVLGTLSTPDVTITDSLTADPIFSKAGIASDIIYQPKMIPVGVTGTALNTAGDVAYESPACLGNMTVVLAGAGAATTGTLYLLMEV